MKSLCSNCGYNSNTVFENGECPLCKNDNSNNDYRKGDKFYVLFEGREKYYRYIDDVINYIECNVSFEVDLNRLRNDVKDLNKNDSLELRYDCLINRIH